MNNAFKLQHNKLGWAIRSILCDFLKLKVGDKILTVDQYTSINDVSRGTYFNALMEIEKSHLARIEKKGQHGSIISKIDYLKIWSFLGFHNFTIVMAYPENNNLKILATLLNKIDNNQYLHTHLIFSRGSSKRIELIKEGIADIAVQSRLSTEISQGKNWNYGVIFEIDPLIYNENVKVYVRLNETIKIKKQSLVKILYDKNSYDIVFLSQELFKNKNVDLIEHSYIQSFDLLNNKIVDIIIHSKISSAKMKALKVEEFIFEDDYSKKLLQKASTAVFVYCKKDPSIQKIAEFIIDKNFIEKGLKNFKVNKQLLNY